MDACALDDDPSREAENSSQVFRRSYFSDQINGTRKISADAQDWCCGFRVFAADPRATDLDGI